MNQSLLFYDGEIVTMTAAKPRAVLVENGKIAALGDFSALSALSPQAEPVSLHGAALLPAFLDAHSHFTQVAYSLLQVSLAEVTTEEALIAAIQQETPRPGQWIIARDFDHNRLPGARRPALAVLDAAAPNNPLVIQHQSGHMGFFNTLGLQALGITPQTTPPPGGRIEVADGRLTGYVEENAFFELLKRLPAPGEAELMAAYQKAQTLYASHGITTVQEGMLVEGATAPCAIPRWKRAAPAPPGRGCSCWRTATATRPSTNSSAAWSAPRQSILCCAAFAR